MKFISDSRALLASLPPLTGDAARAAHRLSRALDLLERDRAAMEAALADFGQGYDVCAANRLANQLQVQE